MEADIALLVLRVGIGGIFVAHGLQKLLGWWGGPGWEGWKGFVGYLGVRPVMFWAPLSVAAELGGGLALIAGLFVPLAAAGLVAQTLVLHFKVHWEHGFWSTEGGIEFPIALFVGALAVQLLGPGSWSLDELLPAVDVLYEPAVRWVILGLAIIGGVVAVAMRPAAQQAPAAAGDGSDGPEQG